MMKHNEDKKRSLYIVLACLCVIGFVVCICFLLNPFADDELNNSLNGNFDTTKDFVKFMDVGQGDSALIYSNGYSAVIDMGTPTVAPEIYSDLSDCDIKEIDAVLISHLHSDHVGALQKVAEICRVKNLIMPEILSSSLAAATNSKNFIVSGGGGFYNAVQGLNFKIGEFEITVLGFIDDKKNENNRSLFTVAEIDGIKFLFTGDAETKAEKYLLNENLNIDCDVLKVSHHGSDTGTSKEFLDAVTPDYAVISVGEGNMYSHPHKQTLDLLENYNAKIYRTDEQGDITFEIDNRKISVNTEK